MKPKNVPLTKVTFLSVPLFMLLSTVSQPQTSYSKFPGPSQGISPDGRYVLLSVENEREPYHSILLKDKNTRKMRKIYDYGRSASVVWAPDSRHFALNDYAGSNLAETYIIAVDETEPRIDLQEEIARHQRVGPTAGDHEYFGVSRWLDERKVVVHHWGHGGSPTKAFCMCYIYTLNGSVEKCTRQPQASNPEQQCAEITP